MFKPELWQSHNEYRTFLQSFSADTGSSLFHPYEKEYYKLLNLNLDPVRDFLSDFFSPQGRPAKNQAQILRSLILFVLLFNKTPAKTSLTSWVRDVLPASHLLTALIGCASCGTLPPLGSYYDFMNRLWRADRDQYSNSFLLPVSKNGKKPDKTIGDDGKLVEPDQSSYNTADIVKNMMSDIPVTDDSQAALQQLFFTLAVLPSVRLGLIDPSHLTVSGDGTAVVSHSSPYGKTVPSVDPSLRHYSDPDASWGWDSSKKQWYFGHTLYLLASTNNKLHTDLPLLMNFTSAARHDSINFLYAFDSFSRNTSDLVPENICLDSAHDNIPTYRLLDHRNIHALIDINGRTQTSDSAPHDISFNKLGHPLCRAGHEMVSWGNDPVKDAHKYRCSLKCGRIDSCPYEAECSPSNYGRTVYIKNHGDLRFHPQIPRDSEEYKKIYSERTACERLNNRFLNDYCLQFLKIRGKDHFSFWTMLAGICIHLDARCKVSSPYSA